MYRDIGRAFWRLPYQFGHSKNVPKNFHVSKKNISLLSDLPISISVVGEH